MLAGSSILYYEFNSLVVETYYCDEETPFYYKKEGDCYEKCPLNF
jgi:hypothetical protein